MRRVARQAILAGQSCHAPVLYATQAALCGGPERAVWIKSKACNLSLAQPVGSGIRCLDLAISEIGNATENESNPQATLRSVACQSSSSILVSQRGPRNLLYFPRRGQAKEALGLVGEP